MLVIDQDKYYFFGYKNKYLFMLCNVVLLANS